MLSAPNEGILVTRDLIRMSTDAVHTERRALDGYPRSAKKTASALHVFGPALVNNVRKGSEVMITFANAFAPPTIEGLK